MAYPHVIDVDADPVNANWIKQAGLDVDMLGSREEWTSRLQELPDRDFRDLLKTVVGAQLAAHYDWFVDAMRSEGARRGVTPYLPAADTVEPMDALLAAVVTERAAGAPPVLADWSSPGIAFKNRTTGDGRALTGDITWAPLPLPLMAQLSDSHGGMPIMESKMAGGIEILTWDGDSLAAHGVLDDTEQGRATAEALATGRYGVSIDLAVDEFEVVLAGMADAEGGGLMILASGAEDAGLATSDDLVMPFKAEDELFVVTKGVIRGATVVPFPAWVDAGITITASGEQDAPTWVRPLHPHMLVIKHRPTYAQPGGFVHGGTVRVDNSGGFSYTLGGNDAR